MGTQLLRMDVEVIACVCAAIAASGLTAAVPDLREPYESEFRSSTRLWQPDGRRVLGGSFARYFRSYPYGTYAFAVERLNGDGTLDTGFNGGGLAETPIWGSYESVNALVLQPDGKIVVGGNAAVPRSKAESDNCYPAFCNVYPALVRLNADGTLDRSFNGTGRLVISIGDAHQGEDCCGSLDNLELQPDGKIVIRSGPTVMARVNADGTLDPAFAGTAQVINPEASALVPIGAGFTGSWFNPAQNGHGFTLEVLPGEPPRLLASWFTFAPQGGQGWIVGLGSISGNQAVLNPSQTVGAGARFPPNFDAADVPQALWGTLTFMFKDCNHGRVDWTATASGYGSGSMDLTRLTLPAGLTWQ